MSSELCRTCLSSENLGPIFSEDKDREQFANVLLWTTGLQIEADDGFPQMMCQACSELVNCALQFRNQSKKSEWQLLKLGYTKKIKKKLKTPKSKKRKHESKKLSYDNTVFENSDVESNYNIFDENETSDFKVKVEIDQLSEVEPEYNDIEETTKNELFVDFHNNVIKQPISPSKTKVKPNDIKKEKTNLHSKKQKRELYMSLVDGQFDPNGPIKCKVCHKTLSKWSSFLSHTKLHLGFSFVCEYCGKSFISSTQLNRHCRSYHGMKRELQCSYCDYLALDNPQLKLHIRREHTGERPFICDMCGASYFSRRCLLQHIENHSTVRPIQCPECPHMFKSSRHLSRHTYSAHRSKEFHYKCSVCNRAYKNYKYTLIHLKKAHNFTTRDVKIIKIKMI